METDSEDYSEYLEQKYLPGRDIYLHKFFYTRIARELGSGSVYDLGFGTGSFLKFLRNHQYETFGIDSNQTFVDQAKARGFQVACDDITSLSTLPNNVGNAVIDNVLEHLSRDQIDSFLKALAPKLGPEGKLIAIVPDKKGFEKDPTHVTFVTQAILEKMLPAHGLKIENYFCFPFNSRNVGKFFYLNMQILIICRNHSPKE